MFNNRRVLSAVLAVCFALSVMSGGAMAAAPVIVTSTTDDTSTTTELQQGSTVANFTGNASKATTIQYRADSNNSRVDIAHNGTGDLVYQNDSANQIFWNSTDNDGHFNVSVNHGELADLERGINDNVTIEVTAFNNTNVSSPDNTSFTAFVETTDAYTVEYVSSSDVDAGEIVEITEAGSFSAFGQNFSVPIAHSNDHSDLSTTRNVTENTTIVMSLGDSNVSEDFHDSTEDTSPIPVAGSSAESGDRLWSMTATLGSGDDAEAVPVYYEQAPDSADTNDTHAIYTQDHGGESAVLIKSHNKSGDVDVNVIGSADTGQVIDAYGYMAAASMFNPMNLIPTDALSVLSIGSFEAPRFAAGA